MYRLIRDLHMLANNLEEILSLVRQIEDETKQVKIPDKLLSDVWEIPDYCNIIDSAVEDIQAVSDMTYDLWKDQIYPKVK